MASYADLDAAFNELLQALTDGFSPFFSGVVSPAWLGALGQAGAIARDRGPWDRLAQDLPTADPVVAGLNAAAQAVSSCPDAGDSAILGALRAATGSLHDLHDFLGCPG